MPEASQVLCPSLFAGRTALVTGGGSGIDRVIARRFAALGAQVVAAGRQTDTVVHVYVLGRGAQYVGNWPEPWDMERP